MGAHHYDIAQWALGMDESGPVKIIPPADPSTGKGVKYVYANGVEMTHGGPGGCTFYGTDGTLRIDRQMGELAGQCAAGATRGLHPHHVLVAREGLMAEDFGVFEHDGVAVGSVHQVSPVAR